MANTSCFGGRINVIPFIAITELEAMFDLMDNCYPKFMRLDLETFTSFFCAILHSWCDDHHMDARRVIGTMQIAICNEVERENEAKRGKENF